MRYDWDTRPCLEVVDATFRAGFVAGNLKRPAGPRTAVRRTRIPAAVIKLRHLHARGAADAAGHSNTWRCLGGLINRINRQNLGGESHGWGAAHFQTHRGYIAVAPGAGKSVAKWPLANLRDALPRIDAADRVRRASDRRQGAMATMLRRDCRCASVGTGPVTRPAKYRSRIFRQRWRRRAVHRQ